MKAEFLYREFKRPDLQIDHNLMQVTEAARSVKKIFENPDIIEAIKEVHKFGSSSAKVQDVILAQMLKLGFSSEKEGLFMDMDVSGIRPDYYKPLEGGGIIFEVERGKTIANNMDLLDVWKTHICQEAKHLFLMVPRVRVNKENREQKIFFAVEKRIGAFFAERVHPIDVHTVHLFGY